MSDCNNNCEAVAGLHEAAANLIQYRNLINSWLNGGQNQTVNIGGQNIPTLLGLAMSIKQLVGVWPDDITIKINPVTKKIYVPLKTNGGVHVDTSGLYIDSSDFLQLGGGLAKDSSGNIYVDFDQMPTSKFDAILETFRKGLRLPKYLTGNKNFYVDKNHAAASDTLDEGRGESPSLPFKTIQACVDYVCVNYNLGDYNINIYIASGTYDPIVLYDYQHNNGLIRLYGPSDMSAIIKAWNKNSIYATGGSWNLYDISVDAESRTSDLPSAYSAMSVLATGGSASVRIYSGKFKLLCHGTDATKLDCRCIRASDNSTINIGGNGGNITIECDVNVSQGMLLAVSGGTMNLFGNNIADNAFKVGGTCRTTASASAQGKIVTALAYTYQPRFQAIDANNVPTYRYTATTGGTINTNGLGSEFFPGKNAGTVESSTYSWYK